MNGNLMKVDEKKVELSKGKNNKMNEWLMSISSGVFLFLMFMWFLLQVKGDGKCMVSSMGNSIWMMDLKKVFVLKFLKSFGNGDSIGEC